MQFAKKMAKIYILYLQKRFNQIIKIVLTLIYDMFKNSFIWFSFFQVCRCAIQNRRPKSLNHEKLLGNFHHFAIRITQDHFLTMEAYMQYQSHLL